LTAFIRMTVELFSAVFICGKVNAVNSV